MINAPNALARPLRAARSNAAVSAIRSVPGAMATSRSRSPIRRAHCRAKISSCWRCRLICLVGTTIIWTRLIAPTSAHLYAGENCAPFAAPSGWVCVFFRGEIGRATGWLARAQRLLEREERDCVEQGYLLLPVVEQQLAAGDHEAAYATAASAAEIGDRFGEADLIACARHLQGRVLMSRGRSSEGSRCWTRPWSRSSRESCRPWSRGLIYCSVIEGCQQVYALGRAREWTAALTHWCEAQPEMVAFTGVCLVHRAEIMQLRGAWRDAIDEARRACERCDQGATSGPQRRRSTSKPRYTACEASSLPPRMPTAARASRGANRSRAWPCCGWPKDARTPRRARSAVSCARPPSGWKRARLLPACVEIMLAAGDVEEARRACDELEDIARELRQRRTRCDRRARAGRARAGRRRRAGRARLAAPRHGGVAADRGAVPGRTRAGLGRAGLPRPRRRRGRADWSSTRPGSCSNGWAPRRTWRASTRSRTPRTSARPHGLTPRELQVLRLVATGKTNKAIAAELFLSEKTIDRHVSNIFVKLDVPSRAAATAYAYEHKLI